jgi:hypothetical protein
MSHHQNAGQNYDVRIANIFGNVAQFKYLLMMVSNQTSIHEEIKRLNSANASHH